MPKSFKFELSDKAAIEVSGESGTIIGRAEYLNTENSYWLRYKTADGNAASAWWDESALIAVAD